MIVGLLNVLILLSLVGLLSFSLSQAWLAMAYWKNKRTPPPAESLSSTKTFALPRVLIQLPIYNEKYVVERLLRAVAKIDYPSELLVVQLLDDSTDETSRIASEVISQISAGGGTTIQHVQRGDRKGFKAGALHYGLAIDDSPFVAVFDADFLPRPSFLKEIVCHFSDPKVGLVQTRWDHVNSDYSVLTKLMALAIDNHFAVEQGGRQACGCFINFNGTAGMWRRTTIDEAGGWSDDCLTEDLDLSFRAQLKGWKFLFLEEFSTPSELPIEMQAIRSQQARWTKGAVENSRKNLLRLWYSSEVLKRKVIGTFHLLNSCIFLPLFVLTLSTAVLAFIDLVDLARSSLYIHFVIILSAAAIIFMYWVSQSSGKNGSKKHSIGSTIISTLFLTAMLNGFSLLNSRAILEALVGKKTPFVRTSKHSILGRVATSLPQIAYYRSALTMDLFLEIGVVAFLAATIFYCLYFHVYGMIDIYLYFGFGYLTIIYFTLRDHFAHHSQTLPVTTCYPELTSHES